MTKAKPFILACMLSLLSIGSSHAQSDSSAPLSGINFPGPGIAGHIYPGKVNVNYHFPSSADIKTYAQFGFKIIRLAVTWERLQPQLNGPFAADYLKRIDAFVKDADKANMRVILDVHNYGKFKGQVIGTSEVPTQAFAQLWSELATHYKDQENLLFGLMNEPNKQDAKTWAGISQAAIDAIRQADASQIILVPATYYSSAARWLQKDGDYSNGDALKTLHDPLDNMVFEAHQYLDKHSTGTDKHCVSADIGVQRLTAFTGWLKQNGFKGFLGEFGATDSETCQMALENTLMYMQDNRDVWYGWSYWVADPWLKNYMFNVYPPDTEAFPQADILKAFVGGSESN